MTTHPPQFTVRLDAGHGGHDFGATYQEPGAGRLVLEKDINLAVALLVPEHLPTSVRPTFSRTTDQFVDLRTRALPRGHHDLFVSVHANALGDPERAKAVRGVEVIIHSLKDTWAVGVARRFAATLAAALGIPMNANPVRENPRLRVLALANDHRDRCGRSLSALRPATHPNAVGRGVGAANTGTPAFVLELGYLTHDDDRRVLLTPAAQAAAAKAIATVIYGLRDEMDPTLPLVVDDAPVEGFGRAEDRGLRGIVEDLGEAVTEALSVSEASPISVSQEPRPLLRRPKKSRD